VTIAVVSILVSTWLLMSAASTIYTSLVHTKIDKRRLGRTGTFFWYHTSGGVARINTHCDAPFYYNSMYITIKYTFIFVLLGLFWQVLRLKLSSHFGVK
jgi:hypothetical protein